MKRILILGAAGRDFHNFNVYYKLNPHYRVVGFTATQIPNITDRIYPKELSGPFHPDGIPIFEEKNLEELIQKYNVDYVVFSYSDVSHEYIMHLASRVNAVGASFILLGTGATMLKSKKKVVAVCATRTGAGKSPLSRKIVTLLRGKGQKVVVIRHPMPYGDLKKQICQRYETLEDLDKYECTIEEREDYEHHIKNNTIVYAGIDYQKILLEAEKEADIILWDGGNNDTSFYKPDLLFVVADALRPDHETKYYPGETNFRMAHVIVINKVSQNKKGADLIRQNAKAMNPKAKIFEVDTILSAEPAVNLKNKKVLIVEDGPTVTHGGMDHGAAFVYAKSKKAKIVDPKKYAVGDIKLAYKKYPHLKLVVPALGYGQKQIKDLEKTINKAKVDYVITGTPIDISRFMKLNKKVVHVVYQIKEKKDSIDKLLTSF